LPTRINPFLAKDLEKWSNPNFYVSIINLWLKSLTYF